MLSESLNIPLRWKFEKQSGKKHWNLAYTCVAIDFQQIALQSCCGLLYAVWKFKVFKYHIKVGCITFFLSFFFFHFPSAVANLSVWEIKNTLYLG